MFGSKKYLVLLCFSFFLLLSCSQKTNATLNADEVYLFAYYYDLPDEDSVGDYTWKFVVDGLVQIKSDFSAEIIRAKSYRNNYSLAEIILSDSLKSQLNRIVAAYPNDSDFVLPKEGYYFERYCGPTYEIVIRKDNRGISLSGIPSSYPEDLKMLIYQLYIKQSKDNLELLPNQDSIQSFLKSLEQYVDAPNSPMPISRVKFQPPLIK